MTIKTAEIHVWEEDGQLNVQIEPNPAITVLEMQSMTATMLMAYARQAGKGIEQAVEDVLRNVADTGEMRRLDV